MWNKNPHIVKCPIHNLHYDETKQDGCALCLKANARLYEARKKRDEKPTGILAALLVSFILSVAIGALLFLFFPPPTIDADKDDVIAIEYMAAPFGWTEEDHYGKAIALDKMGLRTENTTWSMESSFIHRQLGARDTSFIEFIHVLKGVGAIYVDRKADDYISEKILKLKPNSVVTPVVKATEVVQVGGTMGVRADVMYESDIDEFQGLVYYIPAKTSHYWIFMATKSYEWEMYKPTFEKFIESITGGKQGEMAKTELPKFLITPYRALWAAIFVFVTTFYIFTKVMFRKK